MNPIKIWGPWIKIWLAWSYQSTTQFLMFYWSIISKNNIRTHKSSKFGVLIHQILIYSRQIVIWFVVATVSENNLGKTLTSCNKYFWHNQPFGLNWPTQLHYWYKCSGDLFFKILKEPSLGGHSITTWTWFCPFLTTYLPPRGHFLPWTWTKIGMLWPPTHLILST